MRLTTREYVQATVAYADIFHYPLTGDDVYYWCIKKIPGKNFRTRKIRGVSERNQYYFLKEREGIVASYEKRRRLSKNKWEVARSVGRVLQYIPTLLLVGVTGGVAVDNASASDDIDLFFITSKGTLWISRLCVVIILDFLRLRRKPEQKNIKNTICINMFMSEESLGIVKGEQDLFSAHEVLQMVPLWSRGDTYRRFLQANSWVQSFLPVAWSIKQPGRNQHPKISRWYTRIACFILRFFEIPANFFQLWYMKRRRTKEIISAGMLRFHPRDARIWIRSKLAQRLAKFNIPLDNIFYDR
jgi:hypothetical protein